MFGNVRLQFLFSNISVIFFYCLFKKKKIKVKEQFKYFITDILENKVKVFRN